MGKYDGKEFNDPVVRCCDCQTIIWREDLAKIGQCPTCGNRRVRNVTTLKPDEQQSLIDRGIDPEFLAQFKAVNA